MGRPVCSALPQLSFSSGLGSRSLCGHSEKPQGPQAGIPWVSQGPSLPSKRSLPSGSAHLWRASKMPPTLSFSSSSGLCLPLQPQPLIPTLAILPEQLESPAPKDMQFPASVPSLMLFLQIGMPFPCSFCLVCLANTCSSFQSPSKAPSSRKTTPMPLPLQATSALCKCFSPGTYHCISLVYMCVSPPDCEPFRAWTVSYASLFLRLARCLARSGRSINVK